ncbi:hypothetical protein PybrP1_012904, partial [[Pythium] brassicae (nom. inval.)]
PQGVLYEITTSGSLPAFDPLVKVKQRVLSTRQIKILNRVINATRFVFFPMYLLGFALRIPTIFSSAEKGRLLGPIALAFQIPIVFPVVFAFRFEFVKVILGTFEFWFLLLTATIWMFSLGFYLQDARAAIIPSVWLDFVDMLLIETYFQNSQNVVAVAVLSACFMFSLSVGVSLGAIQDVHDVAIARLRSHAFALKDVLANTLATMIMLLVRLSFRKLESLRTQRRAKESWTQSIAYRCRVRLVVVAGTSFSISSSSYSAATPDTRVLSTASAATATDDPDVTGVEHVDGKALLHMRYMRSTAVFDSELTTVPLLSTYFATMRENRVMALLHSCSGVVGLLLIPASFNVHVMGYHAFARFVHIAALTTALAFWGPFFCCGQRQLTARLWTSFDFLFAYMQMVSAHVALCDMLSWDWLPVCGVLASFFWMQGVLTMDTVPPITRERLGWRAWFLVPVLVLCMVLQVLICGAALEWTH